MNSTSHFLLLDEAASLGSSLGLPIVEHRRAVTAEEAIRQARDIGYPVAVKVLSHHALHKSDIGGVELSLLSDDHVRSSFEKIHRRVEDALPEGAFIGVTVSPMLPRGVEAIIGLVYDQELGPSVMFGLGGVAVELYRDVVFRLPPLKREEIFSMVEEIRGFEYLSGYRGRPRLDLDALVDSLEALAGIPGKRPDIKDLELNPLILFEDGCQAADIRIAVESTEI